MTHVCSLTRSTADNLYICLKCRRVYRRDGQTYTLLSGGRPSKQAKK